MLWILPAVVTHYLRLFIKKNSLGVCDVTVEFQLKL